MAVNKFKKYCDRLIQELIYESDRQISMNFPERALVILNRCEEWLIQLVGEGDILIALLKIYYAHYFQFIEDYDTALHNLKAAQTLLQSHSDSFESAIMHARQGLGILLMEFSLFNQVNEMVSNDPLRHDQLVNSIPQCFHQIAIMLQREQNYNMSLVYHEKCFIFARQYLGIQNHHTQQYQNAMKEFKKKNASKFNSSKATTVLLNSITGIHWTKQIEENYFIQIFDRDYSILEKDASSLEEFFYLVGVNINLFRRLGLNAKHPNIDYNIRPNKYVAPPDPKTQELERLKRQLQEARDNQESELEKARLEMIQKIQQEQREQEEARRRDFLKLYNEELTSDQREIFDEMISQQETKRREELEIEEKFDFLIVFIQQKTERITASRIPPPKIITPNYRIIKNLQEKRFPFVNSSGRASSNSQASATNYNSPTVAGFFQVQIDEGTDILILAFSQQEELVYNLHQFMQYQIKLDSLRLIFDENTSKEEFDEHLRNFLIAEIQENIIVDLENQSLTLKVDHLFYPYAVPDNEKSGLMVVVEKTSQSASILKINKLLSNYEWMQKENSQIRSLLFDEKNEFFKEFKIDDLTEQKYDKGHLAIYVLRNKMDKMFSIDFIKRSDQFEEIRLNQTFGLQKFSVGLPEKEQQILDSLTKYIIANITVNSLKTQIKFDESGWKFEYKTESETNSNRENVENFFLLKQESSLDCECSSREIRPLKDEQRENKEKFRKVCELITDRYRQIVEASTVTKYRSEIRETIQQQYILQKDKSRIIQDQGYSYLISIVLYLNNPNERKFSIDELISGKKNTRSKRLFGSKNLPTSIVDQIMRSDQPLSYFKEPLKDLNLIYAQFRDAIWEKTFIYSRKDEQTRIITNRKFDCTLFFERYTEKYFIKIKATELKQDPVTLDLETEIERWLVDQMVNSASPLFYFYVNMETKKIFHRFVQNTKENEKIDEESMSPGRQSQILKNVFKTEKNKEMKREGYDFVEKKLIKIAQMIQRMYAKKNELQEIKLNDIKPNYKVEKVRRFMARQLDEIGNYFNWPCAIIVMNFPSKSLYKAQILELSSVLKRARDQRTYDLVKIDSKVIKHEDYSAVCERLFDYKPNEKIFIVNEDYINNQRKINQNVKQSSMPVGVVRVLPIDKKDFDVQVDIKIEREKRDFNFQQSGDFLLPEYGQNFRSFGTQTEDEFALKHKLVKEEVTTDEYIFLKTVAIRYLEKVYEIEIYFAKTKRELIFRHPLFKEVAIEIPSGIHPKYYMSEVRVFIFNLNSNTKRLSTDRSSHSGTQSITRHVHQVSESIDYMNASPYNPNSVYKGSPARKIRSHSTVIGNQNLPQNQGFTISPVQTTPLKKNVPTTPGVQDKDPNALNAAGGIICVYSPQQDEAISRLQTKFFNKYLFERVQTPLNLGKFSCELRIGYRAYNQVLYVSIITLPNRHQRNLYQLTDLTRRKFLKGLNQFVLSNIKFDQIKGFIFDNQHFLIPEFVLDQQDYRERITEYCTLYDGGPLPKEVKKIWNQVLVEYQEKQKTVIPNEIERAFNLNNPNDRPQIVKHFENDLGIIDTILGFELSFKLEFNTRDTTSCNSVIIQIGNNQRRCVVLSVIKKVSSQKSSCRFKLRFRIGGKDDEIETDQMIATPNVYKFVIQSLFQDDYSREYEIKLQINDKVEAYYSSPTPIDIPNKHDSIYLGSNRISDYASGKIYNMIFQYKNNQLKNIVQPRVKSMTSSCCSQLFESSTGSSSTLNQSFARTNVFEMRTPMQTNESFSFDSPEKRVLVRPQSATQRKNVRITKNSPAAVNISAQLQTVKFDHNQPNISQLFSKTGNNNNNEQPSISQIFGERKTRERYSIIGEYYLEILKICMAVSPKIDAHLEQAVKQNSSALPPIPCLSRDLFLLNNFAKQNKNVTKLIYFREEQGFFWYAEPAEGEVLSEQELEERKQMERNLTLNIKQKPLPVEKFIQNEVSPHFLIEIDRFVNIVSSFSKISDQVSKTEIINLAKAAGMIQNFSCFSLKKKVKKLAINNNANIPNKQTLEEEYEWHCQAVDYVSFLQMCREQLPAEKIQNIKKACAEDSEKTRKRKQQKKINKGESEEIGLEDFEVIDSNFQQFPSDREGEGGSVFSPDKYSLKFKQDSQNKVEKISNPTSMSTEKVLTYNTLDDLKEILVTHQKIELDEEELSKWLLVEIDFVKYGYSNKLIKQQIELMTAMQRDNIVDIPFYFRTNNISESKGMAYQDFRRLLNELRIGQTQENNKVFFRIMAGTGNETLSIDRLHHFVTDFYLEATYIKYNQNIPGKIEDLVQTSMFEYGGMQSKSCVGANNSLASMSAGLNSNTFPVIYSNPCQLRNSNHYFSEIVLHKIKSQNSFSPFFMWPIVQVENDVEMISYHLYENMDNQYEKSIIKEATPFSLKGFHPTLLLQGLEVKYKINRDDIKTNVELFQIEPCFGRKFGRLPLQNNEESKKDLVNDFQLLITSYPQREIVKMLKNSKFENEDVSKLTFPQFFDFIRLGVAKDRYSKQACYQIFQAYQYEEQVDENRYQDLIKTREIIDLVQDAAVSNGEPLPTPFPSWNECKFEVEFDFLEAENKNFYRKNAIEIGESLFTQYFSNIQIQVKQKGLKKSDRDFEDTESDHFSVFLHGYNHPDITMSQTESATIPLFVLDLNSKTRFIEQPLRASISLLDRIAFVVLTRKSEVQIEDEQQIDYITQNSHITYEQLKAEGVQETQTNNSIHSGGEKRQPSDSEKQKVGSIKANRSQVVDENQDQFEESQNRRGNSAPVAKKFYAPGQQIPSGNSSGSNQNQRNFAYNSKPDNTYEDDNADNSHEQFQPRGNANQNFSIGGNPPIQVRSNSNKFQQNFVNDDEDEDDFKNKSIQPKNQNFPAFDNQNSGNPNNFTKKQPKFG